MTLAKRWLVVGALLVIGAMWFGSRALLFLHLAARHEPWWFVGSFVVGAFGAGAVIARHAAVRPWREPAIAAALAMGFLAAIAWAGPAASNAITGPVAIMSRGQLGLASVLSIAGAYAGALLGRRVTSPPSGPAIVVLSGLLINGAMVVTMGTSAALAHDHRFSGSVVPVMLAAIAMAGFATQAVVMTKRPWTCASGGVLVLLLFLQSDGSIVDGVFAVAVLTLVAWVGARIAVRVFRDRWATSVAALPTAHVES